MLDLSREKIKGTHPNPCGEIELDSYFICELLTQKDKIMKHAQSVYELLCDLSSWRDRSTHEIYKNHLDSEAMFVVPPKNHVVIKINCTHPYERYYVSIEDFNNDIGQYVYRKGTAIGTFSKQEAFQILEKLWEQELIKSEIQELVAAGWIMIENKLEKGWFPPNDTWCKWSHRMAIKEKRRRHI